MKRLYDTVFFASTTRLCAVFLLIFGFLLLPVSVKAAPKIDRTLIIVPFSINADVEKEQFAKDVPTLFNQALVDRGFTVVPFADVLTRAEQRNLISDNVGAVRAFAAEFGADYAVMGSFNVLGNAFSLDTSLLSVVGEGAAQPYTTERSNLVDLVSAVEEISAKITDRIKPAIPLPEGSLAGVEIRGLQVLDEDVVLLRLSSARGKVVSESAINEELKRIWALGYFTDVSASLEQASDGEVLVYTVVEKPRIQDVIVNGSDAVDLADILAVMSSRTGSVINERLLAQDIQKITDLYRQEGYYLADVQTRVEPQPSGNAVLVFDVTEGNKLYIKDIVLNGLETLDEDDIIEQMALKERGLFSFLTGTGVLREEYLERDTAAITAYGLNNGYVSMQVSAADVVYEEDGIVVTYTVKEGPRAKLGDILFSGDLIDTPERLLDVVQLDEHKANEEYFSLTVMQDDVKRLTDFYSNYGFAFAEVDVQTSGKEDEDVIHINFAINKKDKVYIRRVTTEGNTRTRDNVILREMRLGDGDVFDGEKVRRTSERLHRLRYFTEVDTEIIPTDNPDEVDLNVKVLEDRTGAVMAGVGYSSFSKVGVSASIEERNLFGRGYNLALRGYLSSVSSALQMSFVNPRLYDTDLGFGYEAYITEYEWTDFTKDTTGNTVRLFYPIGEYTTIMGSYRLDQYELHDFGTEAPRSYLDYAGKNITSALGANVTYDSTDSKVQPSRGWIVRGSLEYGGGGIGGDDNFFKTILEAQTFFMLDTQKNHVLHLRGRIGAVFENSNKPVPVFDRFFIGGINTIRGYEYDDISPRDPQYGDEIGGDRMGFANIEYIWTVEPELGLAVVPFFDIGYSNDSKYFDAFDNLKKSVGLELRWRSPMGDLRFAYGYPLDKSVLGKELDGRFEFSMGQNF